MISTLSLALWTLVIWIAVQSLVFQLANPRRRFSLTVKLYGISLCSYSLLAYSSKDFEFLPDFLSGFFLHGLLFCGYMACYYAVDRSITLRILVELRNAPKGGAMRLDEIREQYTLQEMIERRLSAWSDNGCLACRQGRFFLTKKGMPLARFFSWGSKLYGKR